MRYIVNAAEMKSYDKYTIDEIGIPSLLLMERAALETVQVIRPYLKKETKAAIFAGTGNNGGDALAVGRILSQMGVNCFFYLTGDREKVSNETKKQMEILQKLGLSIHDNFEKAEYDIVIDGLFGIGLTRPVGGKYEEVVRIINHLKEKKAVIVSVDIPSGICADTGKVLGCAVKADITVTFEYAKAGHYFYPGREYTGKLFVQSIGITEKGRELLEPSYVTIDQEEYTEYLPERRPDGNKGTFGKVLLFAGSYMMCGAAILSAEAVLRAGAGMVKIITPESNRVILQSRIPEAMLLTYEDKPPAEALQKSMEWADVFVAGPGIGKSETAAEILKAFLMQGKKPFVLDADGLNLIAQKESLKAAVKNYECNKIVMTPHPGELVRLLKITMENYREDPKSAVQKLAERYSCIVAGKDAVTLVAKPGNKTMYMNLTGNDGMATAGSGDVLAGLTGGLLAQGQEPEAAAKAAVYLHGRAGDKAAERNGRYAMTASDITDFLWIE